MIDTKIEWATHSLNFWWGCAKVSEACRHCYAEAMARIFSRGKAVWGVSGARWLRYEGALRELTKIAAIARETGVRPRVFVNSMSDTFEDHPELGEIRGKMLGLLAVVPECDFLLLTKRPENMVEMVPVDWLADWPAHVWVGTTVENQACADERIPHLLQVPARVRFLSCEPVLGEVVLPLRCLRDHNADGDCDRHTQGCPKLHWVIVGGESGAGAREFQLEWAYDIVRQCRAAGVPVFVKQFGKRPVTSNANLYDFPEAMTIFVHGTAAAGGRLVLRDGKKGADMTEWPEQFRVREFPVEGAR
jgi:protein gp37